MLRRDLVFGGLAGLCGAFAGRKSVEAQDVWISGGGLPHLRDKAGRLVPYEPVPLQPLQPQTQYYGPSVCPKLLSTGRDNLTRAAELMVCGFENAVPAGVCRTGLNLNVYSDPALRRMQRLGVYGIITLPDGNKLANAIDLSIDQVYDTRQQISEGDLAAAEQFLVEEVRRCWAEDAVPVVPTTIPAYQIQNGYVPQARY